MIPCSYEQYLGAFYSVLTRQGAFLTVKDKSGRVNTMTIGWASVGWMWGKPVFTAMVRLSRHTYSLMENADSFTVSAPKDASLNKALAYCGSRSGRDGDKFAACGLTARPARSVDSPVVGEAWLHYECRIVGKKRPDREDYDPALYGRVYADNDLHMLYFGEIADSYTL